MMLAMSLSSYLSPPPKIFGSSIPGLGVNLQDLAQVLSGYSPLDIYYLGPGLILL